MYNRAANWLLEFLDRKAVYAKRTKCCISKEEMRTLVGQIKCSKTNYNLQDQMIVQTKQDTSSKEPNYTVGSTTLPWKSSIPVWRSRRKKRKGWSTMNCTGRLLILRPPLMLIAEAAAAIVPSSLTSIMAFWITFE